MESQEFQGADALDQILRSQTNTESGSFLNAGFAAISKDGPVFSGIHGFRDFARSQPVTADSLFWIASLTKLSTAIAVLIAVEKGLIGLDDNVRLIVPELAEIEILEGFQDGKPQLRKCSSPISLRQLLSHSSGFCYDIQSEDLKKWAAYVDKKDNTFSGSYSGYLYPLIFEPGQGWAYGPGMDWAGRTIEIVAKQDLESFMQANIWTPLQMHSTTFRPWLRPDLEAKRVEISWRGPDGALSPGKQPYAYPAPDTCGGVGLYSTILDQTKLLTALLDGGGGILNKDSLNALLQPQTEDPAYFVAVVCGTKRAHLGQTWPEGTTGDFGLSSSINDQAFPERRAAKSANWQGMPGIHAWLDRETGLAGVFFTQVLPPGDKKATGCFIELEKETTRIVRSAPLSTKQ